MAHNLSDRIQRLARTGDHTGYRSHSEARQAVITACVRAGWNLAQLISRIEDGRWPGLAAMYSRYGNRHSRKAIVRDWNKAHSWLPPQKQHPRNSIHLRNTRAHKSHPPTGLGAGGYQDLRTWQSALAIAERTRWQNEPALILVARAVGRAAQLNGGLHSDHGDRSISLGTGLDIGTVSRALRRLRDEDEPLISRIEEDRGVHADVYELNIPASMSEAATRRPWRPGTLHALRPAFRELGRPAAFVYEELATKRAPQGIPQLTENVPYQASAVRDALHTLEQWGLAERSGTGWIPGPRSPEDVGERLGTHDLILELAARYAEQRLIYRLWLASRGNASAMTALAATVSPTDMSTRSPGQPARAPAQDHDELTAQAVALIEAQLGAQLVA